MTFWEITPYNANPRTAHSMQGLGNPNTMLGGVMFPMKYNKLNVAKTTNALSIISKTL